MAELTISAEYIETPWGSGWRGYFRVDGQVRTSIGLLPTEREALRRVDAHRSAYEHHGPDASLRLAIESQVEENPDYAIGESTWIGGVRRFSYGANS